MTVTNIPSHIPPELVRDFDYFDMDGESDVFLRYKKLHDGPDIFYTPHYGGHWVVTRFEDMDSILFNAQDFSNRHSTVPKQPIRIPLAESDQPLHGDLRKLVQPFFTQQAVDQLEQDVRERTASLIQGFYEAGGCDFTKDFALIMPIHTVMKLLDLPLEDTPLMVEVADGVLHSTDHDFQVETYGRIFNYLSEKIIPQRKSNPGKDIISTILNGRVENGRALTNEEVLGLCCALIAAGVDTVGNMLSFITMFLARNPDYRRQLIDEPTLIRDAVEELVRRHSTGNFTRVVVHDMNYKGLHFKAGDIVMTPTTLAGIDERRYPDPLTVDFRREDKKHLTFGRGRHQCVGIFLARCELRVFLEEWLKRIPDFQIKQGEQPIVGPAKVNCVRYLPLTWPVANQGHIPG